MGEVANVLVAFAVIIFLFRWATSGAYTPTTQEHRTIDVLGFGVLKCLGNNSGDPSRPRSPAQVLGFRPKNVTQEMVRLLFYYIPL